MKSRLSFFIFLLTVFLSTNILAQDPNYVGENSSASPSATGTDSLAMGDGASASGDYAIAIGHDADAGSSNAIAIGNNTIVSGNKGIAIGIGASASTNGIAMGGLASASGDASIALGQNAGSDSAGQFSHASTRFDVNGDAQYSRFVSSGETTDATATNINPDGVTYKPNDIAHGHCMDVLYPPGGKRK